MIQASDRGVLALASVILTPFQLEFGILVSDSTTEHTIDWFNGVGAAGTRYQGLEFEPVLFPHGRRHNL